MKLQNPTLSAEIVLHGAELTSLVAHGFEYIWQADPAFWSRHAPILFPIVGKVCHNTYRVGTQAYQLPQHGFARDSQFQPVSHTPDAASLCLSHSPETLQHYPYPFCLTAQHQLTADALVSHWTVANPGSQDMYFQIGAHPAFNLPDFVPQESLHGYLVFYRQGQSLSHLTVTQLSANGHALPQTLDMALDNGFLPITPTLFAHDALVLEGAQADRVVLCDKHQQPYLQMDFDAPVLGIWSPVNAPFCCIEPWYGRTDAEGFAGDIAQRDYIQRLTPSQSFTFTYSIKPLIHD